MRKIGICNIKNNEDGSKNKLSTCLQLLVVDEAKTDMEYECFKCDYSCKS